MAESVFLANQVRQDSEEDEEEEGETAKPAPQITVTTVVSSVSSRAVDPSVGWDSNPIASNDDEEFHER